MPSNLSRLVWFPSRGMNTAQPEHLIPPDMASDGQDFVIENNSVLKKRDGYTIVNATAVSASPTLNSMTSLRLSSGTNHELVGTSNGDIWEDVSDTITSKRLTGLSTSRPAEYTQFLDTLIVADGTNVLKTWNGTTSANISAAATGGGIVATHLNKLFVSEISVAPSRVDYSATGDFNVWTGAGTDQFNVEQNDGQNVTGMKSYARNELVIFKDRSMHKLLGYDKPSFNLLSIDKTVGCISNRSIQNFKSSSGGGLLIFAYIDGIYVYDGSKALKISSYVQSIWDTINATKYAEIDSTLDIDKGRYIITFPTGSSTTNDTILVVDLLHPWEDANGFHFPIFKWTTAAQSVHTEITASTNTQRIVFGDDEGFKYRYGTLYSDNGDSINSYIATPLFALGNSIRDSDYLRSISTAWLTTAGEIEVYSEIKDGEDYKLQATITSNASSDAIGVDFAIGISPIGIPETTFTKNSNIRIRSRRLKLKFQQNSATRFFNLESPVELYHTNAGKEA